MFKKYLYLSIFIFILFLLHFRINFGIATIQGNSMNNFLQANEKIIYTKNTKSLKRNDVIIFIQNDTYLIKRIIGIPNDKINFKNNDLYINNDLYLNNISVKNNKQEIILNKNEYYVLGDNYNYSIDSRNYGPISYTQIIGKIIK